MPADADASPLRFENVSGAFSTMTCARCDDVSFDVQEGETRIILGAAGSGKTVLLKTAMGLIRATAGQVFLFGEDVTDKPENGVVRHPQQTRDAVSGKRAVRFHDRRAERGLSAAESEIDQDAARARWSRRCAIRCASWNWNRPWTSYPSELSGGMRRRVAIARAVVTKPPLLLYDSPTAGLDPITAHTIMALIIKERDVDNTTALVVTHRYQDGNLVANFRYNPDSGRLDPAGEAGTKTVFMVLREGRLIFEGKSGRTGSIHRPVRHEVCEASGKGSRVDHGIAEKVEWAQLRAGSWRRSRWSLPPC